MIKEYKGHKPTIHSTSYVAENALIIGKVMLGENSSIWPGSVLRGDVEEIIIQADTNLQDGVLVHTNYDMPTIIGKGVTVGHGAVLHGCKVGDNCLIGMGAILLDGSKIGDNCVIGAGSVVTEKTDIPDNCLVLGVPGKIARQINEEEKQKIIKNAQEYKEFAKIHKQET